MKRIFKSLEPPCLEAYREANPADSWEGMRNNAHGFGQAVYDCLAELALNDQGGLCAYCELDVSRQLNTFRVDHFVAKSLSNPQANWGLDWGNMLGCCKGGENKYVTVPNHYEKPKLANLSCDAHVNRLVQKGGSKLQLDDRRGVVLNPLEIAIFPNLFQFDTDLGELQPHPQRCAAVTIENNHYATTFEFVDHTIRVFNLNCPRLCRARRDRFDELEDMLEEKIETGKTPQDVRTELCRQLLKPPYPPFFTVSRLWLGDIAEAFLQEEP